MIDGKTIKFGYGDIAVSTMQFSIILRQIKPEQKVGTYFSPSDLKIEQVGEKLYITPDSLDEFTELLSKLENVPEQAVFNFKTYTFDFSNYKPESVVVVEAIVRAALTNYTQCIAC